MELDVPKVMGILNVTPDSFYPSGRTLEEENIRDRIKRMIDDGADIIDVGGCSTRPGFTPPSEKEEIERLDKAFRILKENWPEFPVSVDTYRAPVVQHVIEKWGVDIINDVSGGNTEIWQVAAEYKLPYILTHNRENGSYHYRNVTAEVITELSKSINELHRLGVNDVIVDPGFGFAKTLEQDFQLLSNLHEIKRMGYPLMVGISRKSMIYKTLGCESKDALAGTIALDSIALMKGADILRVHDVKEASDTVKLVTKLK